MDLLIFITIIIALIAIAFYIFKFTQVPAKIETKSLELPKSPDLRNQEELWIALNKKLVELHKNGEVQEAILIAEEALTSAIKTFGEDHLQVAISLNNLAAFYKSLEKFAEAEPLYLKAISLLEKLKGKEHPDVASCLNNLGDLYLACGKYLDSEKYYKEALSILEKKYGKSHETYLLVEENINELCKIKTLN